MSITSTNYFNKFPVSYYNDVLSLDITRRVNFIEKNLSDPYIFLPYTVKEDEKPEDIAYFYYGSIGYTWLVLLANNIIDPYIDWPLRNEEFMRYLMMKYEDRSDEKGYRIVDWCMNETITDNIVYYVQEQEDGSFLKISPKSLSTQYTLYDNDDVLLYNNDELIYYNYNEFYDVSEWRPMRIYEYETILNNNKREIKLVENRFKNQIDKEFKRLMA